MTAAPTRRTRVRRLPDKAAYDRAVVDAVLDEALVAHLGVAGEGGQPFVVPVAFARSGDHVLLHGSTASRAFRAAAAAPVCLTVTLLDGLVLARSVFNSSMNYRSVMVLGVPAVVPEDDKREALRVLSERLAPGHWGVARQPSAKELRATTVLRLALDECSAKVSAGPPEDDEADLSLPVWAGVVPLGLAALPAQPDPGLAPGLPIPSYAARWRATRDRR